VALFLAKLVYTCDPRGRIVGRRASAVAPGACRIARAKRDG
jgi:hypothetical protein